MIVLIETIISKITLGCSNFKVNLEKVLKDHDKNHDGIIKLTRANQLHLNSLHFGRNGWSRQ